MQSPAAAPTASTPAPAPRPAATTALAEGGATPAQLEAVQDAGAPATSPAAEEPMGGETVDDWRRELELQAEQTKLLVQHNAMIREHLRSQHESISSMQKLDEASAGVREQKDYAAANAQKRAEREKEIRRKNAEMHKKIKQMRSRTDQGKAKRVSPTKQQKSGGQPANWQLMAPATAPSSPFHASPTKRSEASLARYKQYDDEDAEVTSLREMFQSPRSASQRGPSVLGGSPDKRFAGDGASRFSFVGNSEFHATENTTHAPVGESNYAQRYFAASETKRNPRGGWSANPAIPMWNNRAYRGAPYECRGMRPIVSTEPWSADLKRAWGARDEAEAIAAQDTLDGEPPGSTSRALIVSKAHGRRDLSLMLSSEDMPPEEVTAGGAYATSTLKRLNDGMHDSVAQLFNRRLQEDIQKAQAWNRKPWDNTPWRYTPNSLKGLKPVTHEPWAEDDLKFNRETKAIGVRDEPFDDRLFR